MNGGRGPHLARRVVTTGSVERRMLDIIRRLSNVRTNVTLIRHRHLFLVVLFDLRSTNFGNVVPGRPRLDISRVILGLKVRLGLLADHGGRKLVTVTSPATGLTFDRVVFRHRSSFGQYRDHIIGPATVLVRLHLVVDSYGH